MAYAAPQTLISAPPDEPILYGRPFLEGTELQQISQRSDLRGAMQLGAHIACIAATTLLVWFALPFWYLMVPAMAVHGVAIVTLFAPMHECVHRAVFASRTANVIVGWIAGVLSFPRLCPRSAQLGLCRSPSDLRPIRTVAVFQPSERGL